jgi:hypothetical protein
MFTGMKYDWISLIPVANGYQLRQTFFGLGRIGNDGLFERQG